MFQCYYESPIGCLLLRATQEALIEVRFDPTLDLPIEMNDVLRSTMLQLRKYFLKQRMTFEIPLSPQGTEFQVKVWEQLRSIDYGRQISYLQLAKQLGNPLVIRAAATANGKNPIPIIIPCHRVVGSKGELTGFSGGLWRKQWLLEWEGNTLF